nr:MAG TPA: hypothetical protein [Caudoviricetes sp.]
MDQVPIKFKTASGKTIVVALSEPLVYPPELYIHYEESDQDIAMIRQIESDLITPDTKNPGVEILLWEDPLDDDYTRRIVIPEHNYTEEE